MRHLTCSICAFVFISACLIATRAEDGILVLHVADTKGQPVPGVVLTTMGDGSASPPTDTNGKTRIKLSPQTKPNTEVALQIVRAPTDLVFVSPWDGRIRVPPFENDAQNFASLVLVKRGDRAILEYGPGLVAIVARINLANALRMPAEVPVDTDQTETLKEVSEIFGLSYVEVDHAIRMWGASTADPYEKGLAALYKENYPEAQRQLTLSIMVQKKTLEKYKSKLADTYFFLGQSLYEQGSYHEATKAYEEASRYRPGDSEILDNLGRALCKSGRHTRCELFYRRALTINEKTFGPEHPKVATLLNNLGVLLIDQEMYGEAERLLNRALSIQLKKFGGQHPDVATTLNNIASLYDEREEFDKAKPLYFRALYIRRQNFGPDHPAVAIVLNNICRHYDNQNNCAEAETFCRQALTIREKHLGLEHPATAITYNNLGLEYYHQKKYPAAEALFLKAIAAKRLSLGDVHPSLAITLNNLALLYTDQGKYSAAEPLYKDSLEIWNNTSLDYSSHALTLENYARMLRMTDRATAAGVLEERAKAMRAKLMGENRK